MDIKIILLPFLIFTNIIPLSAFKIDETAVIRKHPRDTLVDLGEDAIFKVKAEGKEPITYKWFHNGLEMAGENSNILKIENVSLNDVGRYSCKVENIGGGVFSNEAFLAVGGNLNILVQPEDVVSFTGPDHISRFSVLVIGSLPIEYQWQHNGENIEGEDDKELEIDTVTPYDAGSYRCVISNNSGKVYTNEAKLEVRRTVEIIKQPQKKINKNKYETARFSISTSGYGNISYQWQKRSVDGEWKDLMGKTKPTLEISLLHPEHSGQYRCKAKNGGGTDTSDLVELIIEGALILQKNLKENTVGWSENNITLRVHISGSVPINIQWFKIGKKYPIRTKTNYFSSFAELTLDNLNKEKHEGKYFCIINNSDNEPCTSNTTNLLIKKSVRIIKQPEDASVEQGEKVRMSIEVEGDPDITYQWLKDGIPKIEYRSKTLLIERVSSSQSGTYRCIAKNEGRADTSETAILEVDGTIIVKRPKEGEQWKIGSVKKIEWECLDESIKLVDIWFSENGGEDYNIIRENAENRKGELQWIVPDLKSSTCKIKISSSENKYIDDESEGFFLINTFNIPIINFRNKSKLFSRDQFQIFPNPVKSGMDQSIFFVLNSPIKIRERVISIYDALGNKIAVMPGTQFLQENNRCNLGSWDLLNRSHEKISTGVYLAVLTITDTSGNRHILKKFIGIYDQP